MSRLTAPFLLLLCVVVPGLEAVEVDPVQLARDVSPYQEKAIEHLFLGDPATDVAEDVKSATWFSFMIFLPFLVLPEILLLVVIFRFRDRRDGRKPATFIHNNRLEIIWTAIPIFALIVVAIPMLNLLDFTDRPHPGIAKEEAVEVEVTGKQFSWVYEYPAYRFKFNVAPDGRQLPVILREGRVARLWITSQDVNHAWWVPAFGVKRDAFADRFTHTWFTPTRSGWFEGNCAELCGYDHGMMVITARVLEPERFEEWAAYQTWGPDAREVVDALSADEPVEPVLAAYLDAGDDLRRRRALRFWAAYAEELDAGAIEWADPILEDGDHAEEARAARSRHAALRDRLDDALDRVLEKGVEHFLPAEEGEGGGGTDEGRTEPAEGDEA